MPVTSLSLSRFVLYFVQFSDSIVWLGLCLWVTLLRTLCAAATVRLFLLTCTCLFLILLFVAVLLRCRWRSMNLCFGLIGLLKRMGSVGILFRALTFNRFSRLVKWTLGSGWPSISFTVFRLLRV